MEDQVPFKVYMFWSKESKPEVRRFGVDKGVVTSFHYLTAKLLDLFPRLREKSYTVSWKDEDGDDVAVSSDEEMLIALSQVTQGLVKLNVQVKETDADAEVDDGKEQACEFFAAAFSDASAAAAQSGVPLTGMPHAGVVCDSCDSPVVGFRYKCATCPDYDLCSRCETAGTHAEHCMVRVPIPFMPRHLIKAAIKRSRQFLKTVAVADDCPYKKHRRDKSGDRKPHRREHREHRERRPRTSWLETFATYMNEFANLAGDTDCNPPTDNNQQPKVAEENKNVTQEARTEAPKTDNQATEAPKTGNQATEAPKTDNQATETGEKTEKPNGGGAELQFEKLLNPENVKYLLDLQKTLTDILIPNLVPGSKSVSTPPPTPANEIGKEPSLDKVSVKSGTGSDGQDTADDWTVINNSGLMDVAGAAPSAPQMSAPIGFNLPEEFQKRVSINPEDNIYPPLHTATAVLDPVPAREQTPPQAAASTPAQPAPAATQPAPTQAQTQPKPRPRHPKAHIEAAIQQMLAMGFNNDSGWLTQLLETKDGNISAVLDLLTPGASRNK